MQKAACRCEKGFGLSVGRVDVRTSTVSRSVELEVLEAVTFFSIEGCVEIADAPATRFIAGREIFCKQELALVSNFPKTNCSEVKRSNNYTML